MTITKPFRFRRILKWAGVGVCVVVIAAWMVNTRYAIWINFPSYTIWLGDWMLYVYGLDPLTYYCDRTQGLEVEEYFDKAEMWPVLEGPTSGLAWLIGIPLWLLLFAFALPTFLMWRRDWKRIPEGCCQSCGYNLTGNVSGRCSECGTVI